MPSQGVPVGLESIAGLYTLGRMIGSGSFGQVHLATQKSTGEEVAVKLESVACKHPMLPHEAKLLSHLRGIPGVAKLHYSGMEEGYYVMVMDCLGPSLEDLFHMMGQSFSLKTVLMIAGQILYRIEHVHSKHYLHRDIKPDNLLVSRNFGSDEQGFDRIYMIDFGLAKRYRDSRRRQHIPMRKGKCLTGTARYASINTHLGLEQSRRDDLEAIGYMLMYFLRGSLPWQSVQGDTKEEKYAKILECKQNTPVEELCKGYPSAFASYLNYTRMLRFEDQPDYAYVRRLFKDVFFRLGLAQPNMRFDWSSCMIAEDPAEKEPADENEARVATKTSAAAEHGTLPAATVGEYPSRSTVGLTTSTQPPSSHRLSHGDSKSTIQAVETGNPSTTTSRRAPPHDAVLEGQKEREPSTRPSPGKETQRGLVARMASIFACGNVNKMSL